MRFWWIAVLMVGCSTSAVEDAGSRDAISRRDANTTDAGILESGVLDAACASHETLCGDAGCVDLLSHREHCGRCDFPCNFQICQQNSCVPAPFAEEEDLIIDTVATGLEIIWEIRFLPSGDLLVNERPGRITRVSMTDGSTTTLATLPVRIWGEGGLMGLALSPTFASDATLFVCYTYLTGGRTRNRISRLRYTERAIVDEVPLVENILGNLIHNGCRLGFGPDDKLYATMGEAGTPTTAQDLDSLNGKVLRLNPDGSVPDDNPFAGSYVYSLGHRNPQGIGWHPVTNTAYVSEHGEWENDEVNRIVAGNNYGWPLFEGAPGEPGYEDALYFWIPTIAPASAIFYNSPRIPGWQGAFLIATLKEEDLRMLIPADDTFTSVAEEKIFFDDRFGRLRAVRQGPDGHLYIGTTNRDERVVPGPDDDRILRVRYDW